MDISLTMSPQIDVQARYQRALEALTTKLKQDRYILAAILFGSLARGEGWQKSNADLVIICEDGKRTETRHLWLTEDEVIIETLLVPRNHYKRGLERALQGTQGHSIRSLSKLLFCKDASIAAWFEETDDVGARDQERQALHVAANIPPLLRKAEKWLIARRDVHYSFLWILYVVNELARVELILNGKAPAREVIHQAMEYNPTFFKAVYTDLIERDKTPQTIQQALNRIEAYLEARAECLFKPILTYLAEAEDPRTISDLDAYFKKRIPSGVHLYAYEWLAEKGIIQKVATPLQLTKKSRVAVEEPAYFFDAAAFDWANWIPKSPVADNVQQRFRTAVETLAGKLEQDRYIQAAILYGSLSRGDFWAKSDIDLFVVCRDDTRARNHYWLVENGLNFDTAIIPRSHLKRGFDGALQGSFSHSIRSQCTFLFSKDETLRDWLVETDRIGVKDQTFQVMRAAASIPYLLRKAEKWLVVRQDVHYSFLWTMFVVNALASVEVISNGEAPGREVIHQALKYNPTFFKAVYTDLIDQKKDASRLRQALDLIDAYLTERTERIFKPILDYLLEAEEPRTASDLNAHFRKKVQTNLYGFAYEWLVEKGVVEKVSIPLRLTKKSQVAVEEAAYFYDGEEPDWEWL